MSCTVPWSMIGLLFLFSLLWQFIGAVVFAADWDKHSDPPGALIIAAFVLGPLILPLRLVYKIFSRS